MDPLGASETDTRGKAYIAAIEMGYGHERAAYALRDLAHPRVLLANNDSFVTEPERKIWDSLRSFYENVSRLHSLPLVGKSLFGLYDFFQTIPEADSTRNLRRPNLATLYFDYLLQKKQIGRGLAEFARQQSLPLISTHFAVSLSAESHGLDPVYCVITDTDLNRAWVARKPSASRIVYLAPTSGAARRLLAYGVPEYRIRLTGFPLPRENLGPGYAVLWQDMARRLTVLDPEGAFRREHSQQIQAKLEMDLPEQPSRAPAITFCLGGAGAQIDIALELMRTLRREILTERFTLNISTGVRRNLRDRLLSRARDLKLDACLGRSLNLHCAETKDEYFSSFNQLLRSTDVFWTKPSELCFYTALGLPIVIAPAIGAQEVCNRRWLLGEIGSGLLQPNLRQAADWIAALLRSGKLAQAAWSGLVNAPADGVEKIAREVGERKQ